MIIQAKKFKNRTDLENEVRNKVGLTTSLKPDHKIIGTRNELAVLHLSDTTIFWGIRSEITDTPTKPKKVSKISRGATNKKKK